MSKSQPMLCPKCKSETQKLGEASSMSKFGSERVDRYAHCDKCNLNFKKSRYINYHKRGNPAGRPCIQTR